MASHRDDFDILLPHLIDHFAKTKPAAVYAEYPLSPTSYDLGFRPITFRDLANTVNGIAWWLTETLGRGNGEVLAYIGPNDLRYPALVLGALKAGYVVCTRLSLKNKAVILTMRMFLTSPRNSAAAHESRFKSLNCTKLLAPSLQPMPVQSILSTSKARLYNVPSVEELLGTRHRRFEFSRTYSDAAREPLLIVHTSGSTGIPKPIIWNHEFVVKNMNLGNLEPPPFENMSQWPKGKRVFLAPPPFHAAGLIYLLYLGVPTDTVVICPTASSLPTAAGLVETMNQTPINAAFVVPSIVHELAHDPELLEYCSQHLDLIMYAGGDLPQAIGDTVASKLLLVKYGASELGVLTAIYSPTHRGPQRDWRYLHLHPKLGAEFRQITEGEYELVLVRTKETETHLPPFTIFPELIDASDDDVVVFLNGEKTNPISMEQHVLASNPGVTGVLVSGAKRVQASLLVEIAGENLSPAKRATAIQRIWPSIEEANPLSPGHARIDMAHILLTTVDRPMLRTSKGTIQRVGTLALYARELDELYARPDRVLAGNGELARPSSVDDVSTVVEYTRNVLISVTGWDEDKVKNEDNLFHLGFDSRHAITAARQLMYGLDVPDVTANLIYYNPSVSELTDAIIKHQNNQGAHKASEEEQHQERSALLQEFLRHIRIDKTTSEITGNNTQGHTVLLTGSTGTLGTYILDTLLKDPSVTHVYCLNRSHDSKHVQLQTSIRFSLTTSLSSSRVSFYTADLSHPDLALPRETLNNIRKSITHIIHNAWPGNFNLSLASFKPHLVGLANIINLATTALKSPHLFYISSISSVMNHHNSTPTASAIPEEIMTTTSTSSTGYGSSKYLAENLINHAVKVQHLRASVARVGQIAAAVNGPGTWKKEEWFPSLVRSSLWLGALPKSLGSVLDRVDWVPVDVLATVLVELALGSSQSFVPAVGLDAGVEVFHPNNTFPTDWDVLTPTIASILASYSGRHVETVPLTGWIELVRQDLERTPDGDSDGSDNSSANRSRRNSSSDSSAVSGDGESLHTALDQNPAVKLLGFFEGLVVDDADNIKVFETSRAVQRSKKLRGVPGVSVEWVKKWVNEILLGGESSDTGSTVTGKNHQAGERCSRF
ncbi:hypothetical protein BJY00DRAFT_307607 [Aspergillus carlsbadensis]|nr:hypothetical protein BJY00DRAFT_307607 [Aspergillus carlsbadensis]